jgi:phosphatidylglycerol:prolipoprotein diacylglycerol transferase
MKFAALPFPEIDPVALQIGPLALRWYALAYIAGILLGWAYARHLVGRPAYWRGPAPLTPAHLEDFVLYATVGIVLGGRIGYALFYNWPYYSQNPGEILALWQGGMSFHGGLLGIIAAILLFSWRRGVPLLSLADVVSAAGPIGLFFGRIANFVNGELYGRVGDVPWAMVFPHAGPEPRHPSQLYEAALEGLLLFAILHVAIRAGALTRPGLVTGLFLAGYALARSFAELFRQPDEQIGFLAGGLTMGSLLSLPMLLGGALLIYLALRRPRVAEAHRG